MRLLKWLGLGLLILCLCVLAAGVYRFNFTDDDIYVQMPDGTVIPWVEYEQQDQNQTND